MKEVLSGRIRCAKAAEDTERGQSLQKGIKTSSTIITRSTHQRKNITMKMREQPGR
jgi:hypothetical protein